MLGKPGLARRPQRAPRLRSAPPRAARGLGCGASRGASLVVAGVGDSLFVPVATTSTLGCVGVAATAFAHIGTAEPSWHRRARRARQRARAVIAVAQARNVLQAHHGGGGPIHSEEDPMARGRWARDNDGWHSRRGRSSSRGRSRWNGTNGGSGNGWRRDDDRVHELQKDNDRLRKELGAAQKGGQVQQHRNGGASVLDDAKPHPSAKEGPRRDGDWACVVCGFGTNRYARLHCFRCAAHKAGSFSPGVLAPNGSLATPMVVGQLPSYASVAAGAAALAAATGTSPSTSASPSTSTPTPTAPTTTTTISIGSALGQPPPAAAAASAAAVAAGQDQVKALKAKLEDLIGARATLAASAHCQDMVASIDAQILRTRAQLAEAQPMDVALRTTLGAITQARGAVQRAEARVEKLEGQVVAAVAAYDAAAADLQLCRRQLADAQATTARAAGGHIDMQALFLADPGAAWTALQAAAAARCTPGAPGVTPQFMAEVDAAFKEMHRVCSLLSADVPRPGTGEGGGAGVAGAADGAPLLQPPTNVPRDMVEVQGGPHPSNEGLGVLPPEERRKPAEPPADATQVQAIVLQPSSPTVPSQFEAVVAASAGAQAAQQPTPPGAAQSDAGNSPQELVPPLEQGTQAALQAHMLAAQLESVEHQAQQQAVEALRQHQQQQQQQQRLLQQQQQQAQAAALAAAAAATAPQLAAGDGGAGILPQAASAAAVPVPPEVDLAAAGAAAGAHVPPLLGSGVSGSADASMGRDAAEDVHGKRRAMEAGRAVAAKAKARAA